jgi:hypothetical protein
MDDDAVFRALADASRRTLLDRLHARNGQTLVELVRRAGDDRARPSPSISRSSRTPTSSQPGAMGGEKRHFINPCRSTTSPSAGSASSTNRACAPSRRSSGVLKEKTMTDTPASRFVYVTYIRTTPERLWSALTSSDFAQQYWLGYRPEAEWKLWWCIGRSRCPTGAPPTPARSSPSSR